jgi:hypothetical protein
VAKEPQKNEEEDGGEFADFLADVSQEIAQRVESLDPRPKSEAAAEARKTPVAGEERKKTPAAADAGLIAEWPNIVDRMIEEMR